MAGQTKIFDVIIVGCGPIGAFAANVLGAYGHEVLVIEQGGDTYPLPRAVHIDHEMMRLFDRIGLSDDILPRMREAHGHLHLGADGDVIRYMGSHGKPKRFAWANDYFFFQPELEASLRAGMARFVGVDFKQNMTVTQIELADNTHVTAVGPAECPVTLTCDSRFGQLTFSGRFVIGCDGARSTVRKLLGIPLDDLDFEEDWLVVDADVTGAINFPNVPSLPAGANLQTLSVMWCNPARPMTIVPGRGFHRRWEFMLLPGETEAEIDRPGAIEELVAPWLDGCEFKILRKATYRFHGLVARRWRQGRVFLAGDAAHQTPPFFGQGMCHGMRDISNLSFKLDLVLRGLADPDVLDTYEHERDPQVRHIIGQAVAAGRYICELDPAKAACRDEEIRRRQREGRDIATAAELIAPYVTGLVAAGAGERFVHPWIRTAAGQTKKLDELTGGNFTLISHFNNHTRQLSSAAVGFLHQIRAETYFMGPQGDFVDTEGFLERAFADHAACHVLVRPDYYVYGWAQSLADLEELIENLRVQLRPSQTRTSEILKHNA